MPPQRRECVCTEEDLSYATVMTSQLFVGVCPQGKRLSLLSLCDSYTHAHTYIHTYTYINAYIICYCSFKRSCPTWMTRNSCSTRNNQYATPRAPLRNTEAPAATAWGTMRSSSDTQWRKQIRCKEFHLNMAPRWVTRKRFNTAHATRGVATPPLPNALPNAPNQCIPSR